ncbi:MAG: PilT/PilU family type 4a pilus ATPase [Candidatus Berkiella sp.]
MDLKSLLIQMQQMEGSDLYLTTGAPPSVKAHGKLQPISEVAFEVGEVKKIAYQIMDAEQRQHFEMKPEMNLALSLKGIGRFRVNIFIQRSEVGMVIRRIHTEIPSLETLNLPPILKEIITEKRGLVLFVGATGSGKSTSMAALINHRNEQQAGHIITIEDPIEFVHSHKKSIVNQREVGVDTDSYEDALKNTLRQAPDLILIGEIRSRETMEHAIAFSETGHLCVSTLHANSANQALDRIINFFPEERKNQLLLDLSFNLKAIISQRLIPTKDGKRTIAIEILLGTPLILSLINRGEISQLKEVMEKSKNLGMQTFDQALEALYFEGKISLEEAIRNADSKNNLRLKIQLAEKGLENNQITVPSASTNKTFSQDNDDKDQNGLSIVED